MSVPAPAPLPDVSREGERVVEAAAERGLTVRLLGGAAVVHLCPSARRPPLVRELKDLDIAGLGRERTALEALLGELGYRSEEEFNVLQGGRRLLFLDPANDRRLDVLLGSFEMCHALDLEPRLGLHDVTLPPADLLLTKLQVRETNERDLKDALALLLDVEPDADRIAQVLASDWGWWRTATEVLRAVDRYAEVLPAEERETARARIAALLDQVERTPKGVRWRARARMGDRIRWYEEPDEDY